MDFGFYLPLQPWRECKFRRSIFKTWKIRYSETVKLLILLTDATSGGTIDYTHNAGISYSYVPELRGNGFVVPPSEIPLSFEEVWNGMVAMVDEIDAIGV